MEDIDDEEEEVEQLKARGRRKSPINQYVNLHSACVSRIGHETHLLKGLGGYWLER